MTQALQKARTRGFTIVELIIVIVVIGILAAVSIVAYNGVTGSARDKSVISDVDGVEAEVVRYGVKHNGAYGSSVQWYSPSGTNSNINFTPTAGNIVDVIANTNAYCIRVYNPATSTYKSLATAYKKGSTTTICDELSPSASAIAAAFPASSITGVVGTLAGSTAGYTDDTGAAAQFNSPRGVAVDGSGNLFIADGTNHRIRKVTQAGVVTTLAGSTQGYLDGTGAAAQFNAPSGIAIGPTGDLFVGDQGNHRIRKVTQAGVVTTLAGSTQGYLDGTGAAAQFNSPYGIVVSPDNIVFVADPLNNRIRKVTQAGVVTTLAGSTQGYLDGTGTAARFGALQGIALDAWGNLYIGDGPNNRIRKVTQTGVVTTVAGSTLGDTDGPVASAKFRNPRGIAVAADGTLYVVDNSNNRIRKISPDGVVSILAGTSFGSNDGTGTTAQFASPGGITLSNDGTTLYVTDNSNNRIRKIQ